MKQEENSLKILSAYRKTVKDGLNPPLYIDSEDAGEDNMLSLGLCYSADRYHVMP